MGYLGTKPANSPLTSELIPDGIIGTSDIADGAITTAKIGNGAVVPADLSSDVYVAKAWVNFNGTGTVAIRASGNVTSITDVGTGVYTINFTNAFSDSNYSWTVGGWNNGAGNGGWVAAGNGTGSAYPAGVSTSSLGIVCFNTGGSSIDESAVCVSVFK
jgi:hypothetical protein